MNARTWSKTLWRPLLACLPVFLISCGISDSDVLSYTVECAEAHEVRPIEDGEFGATPEDVWETWEALSLHQVEWLDSDDDDSPYYHAVEGSSPVDFDLHPTGESDVAELVTNNSLCAPTSMRVHLEGTINVGEGMVVASGSGWLSWREEVDPGLALTNYMASGEWLAWEATVSDQFADLVQGMVDRGEVQEMPRGYALSIRDMVPGQDLSVYDREWPEDPREEEEGWIGHHYAEGHLK